MSSAGFWKNNPLQSSAIPPSLILRILWESRPKPGQSAAEPLGDPVSPLGRFWYRLTLFSTFPWVTTRLREI
jgi:hypothetical protein